MYVSLGSSALEDGDCWDEEGLEDSSSAGAGSRLEQAAKLTIISAASNKAKIFFKMTSTSK